MRSSLVPYQRPLEIVGIQFREQLHSLLEEVHNLLLWLVANVAGWIKGADAGTMLAPFVLPERFVIGPLVFPVDVHVIEEIIAVASLENLRDVGVLAGLIAVLTISAVAVVWP